LFLWENRQAAFAKFVDGYGESSTHGFLLDTGAIISTMTRETADERNMAMLELYGKLDEAEAQIEANVPTKSHNEIINDRTPFRATVWLTRNRTQRFPHVDEGGLVWIYLLKNLFRCCQVRIKSLGRILDLRRFCIMA